MEQLQGHTGHSAVTIVHSVAMQLQVPNESHRAQATKKSVIIRVTDHLSHLSSCDHWHPVTMFQLELPSILGHNYDETSAINSMITVTRVSPAEWIAAALASVDST